MANTLFTGKVYYRFDELPSTNDYALELIAKSRPPEGTAVSAAIQTAGRGQFGSKWESAPGQNLTISLIFYPAWLLPEAQFLLSMAAALAVRETVESLRPAGAEAAVAVKWPNDIYLDRRKTAGILIQNTLSGKQISASVIGIGLNVNQTDFPPELPNPSSLARAFNRTFDLDAVVERLFECLEKRYLQLRHGGTAAILSDYNAHLYRLNVPSAFRRTHDGADFNGIIRGAQADGRLMVETATGNELFSLKDIQLRIE